EGSPNETDAPMIAHRSRRSEGESPHSMSIVLYGDDGSIFECTTRLFEHIRQAFDHAGRPSVANSKHDDAYDRAHVHRNDFTEVQVERQEDPVLRARFGEYLVVGQSLKTFFSQVNGVVTRRSQPLDSPGTHAHVGQESHAGIPDGC